ncbi:peptide ABC transporter permease [Nocardioides flavus (ex Wang et al. 2016)]|uniref:Peptide ABC transporter permease n=1 Tax=Nocardioides flavus (ex Wang et al. 2016) TaxID=2058780 RepID=A0ABQ3HRM1_9ACTN|nr:ABC transporter permease [Nocardioides flavus (ex Wang et al. 2016)]GHE19082.1 peptide ABC transporter permease [Nocardioides flavus (ex Wang et al. 2016)]
MSAETAGPETLGSLSDEPQQDPNSQQAKEISGKSPLRIALGRLARDKIAVVCAVVVLFFVICAMFAGTISDLFGVSLETPLASERVDGLNNGLPKPEMGPPVGPFTWEHPMGVAPRTGEDNLAYWLHGCRVSLLIAFTATLIASVVGVVIGLLAGFLGGAVDKVLSFFIDMFLTIPFLLAALTLAPILNERFNTSPDYPTIQKFSLVMVLAMFGWMGTARLIRGEVLALREREFVQAARVMGMPTSRILFKELLPNLAAPIIISVSLMLPAFVALEAGLAYLGIGVTDGVSWGQTILKAATPTYFREYPQYLWQPLLGIVALVLSLNLLGDAVRDALDPKTRR